MSAPSPIRPTPWSDEPKAPRAPPVTDACLHARVRGNVISDSGRFDGYPNHVEARAAAAIRVGGGPRLRCARRHIGDGIAVDFPAGARTREAGRRAPPRAVAAGAGGTTGSAVGRERRRTDWSNRRGV